MKTLIRRAITLSLVYWCWSDIVVGQGVDELECIAHGGTIFRGWCERPQDCNGCEEPPSGNICEKHSQCIWKTCKGGGTCFAIAIDPNDKTGASGVGQGRFLTADGPLPYQIHFENLATATAAAQQVVVTDQLNPQTINFSALSLGPISFGATTVAPPAGLTQFSRNVDLRPAQNLIVRIDANLNQTTGLLTWRFSSIDPSTLQLTQDPLAGFLPPNVNPPAGEGAVVFTVNQKTGLSTGAQIQNQASVVFDLNPPIATPAWSNTIDRTPPVTHVLPLPATESAATFPVQWTGSDVGSGIGVFSVYVSDNGAPFTVWQNQTTNSSGTFTGQPGHSYRFYSIGQDFVGNQEPAKTTAEATTQVVGSSACAQDVTGQVTITRSGYGFDFTTGRFVQTVTLANSGGSVIAGPISLVLDNLSSNATLFAPAGTTTCAAPLGSPFANITGPLNPAGTTTVNLQFNDPSKEGIKYTTRVLGGAGTR